MKPDWIAVDWGTSRLRAWAMGPEGVVAEAQSAEGMGQIAEGGFELALLRLVWSWLGEGPPVPVVVCGMAGARQGWHEAPYRNLPCTPVDPQSLVPVPAEDPRISVRIVPGLAQPRPADVMRGEETQIAGALALLGHFDGVICLPGTHSKWAQVSAGEVVSFRSFLTGELFALLSERSVLRHGLAGEGWDEEAFLAAVSDGMSHPQKLGSKLFGLRAEGLLQDLPPAVARARLSGLLIGLELVGARSYWLGQSVVLVGEEGLATRYATALGAQGGQVRLLPGPACTVGGLAAAMGLIDPSPPAGGRVP
ncbi:2-dehydro-3-deoxygalactonokinase [Rhodobacter sp. NSM]|uniref:2-dehydro-3-deoxygalactonokinase n=1 Tax=Rhodobacter sp. NSM TaxID=3457501 RepID=UPI003FCF4309